VFDTVAVETPTRRATVANEGFLVGGLGMWPR